MTPGRLAQVACILETTARKPGNVHREADFADATYLDFLLSAAAIAGPLDRARATGVGAAVLAAVEATREVAPSNTNLGMILLLAPLAAVEDGLDLRAGVEAVLHGLTVSDAAYAYRAIRLARPGGLGESAEQDVRAEPSVTLREAMRLAADRDAIARQYANGFGEVFDLTLPALHEALANPSAPRADAVAGGGWGRAGAAGEPPAPGDQRATPAAVPLEEAIVRAYLHTLARLPDTLIARKRGRERAIEVSRRAASVLRGADSFASACRDFDAWLRAEALNPGATADLTTAALYAALREGTISLPIPPGGWAGGAASGSLLR